jgi:hypothetical protein
MVKIEVRIRHSHGEMSIEHEYRAELPDAATADQIAAVGREAEAAFHNMAISDAEPEHPAEAETIAWPKANK